MEQYYPNWTNGYNNYQPYPPPVPALPTAQSYTPAPAMVLYGPQLYSTVNQNQIHLHLHGAGPEKLEQYLDNFNIGSISAEGMNNLNRNPSGVEVGIGTSDMEQEPPVIIKNQHEESDIQDNQEVGESNIKWRPYYNTN
jgi:hypothetical protein